jgi:hypothetical protein
LEATVATITNNAIIQVRILLTSQIARHIVGFVIHCQVSICYLAQTLCDRCFDFRNAVSSECQTPGAIVNNKMDPFRKQL